MTNSLPRSDPENEKSCFATDGPRHAHAWQKLDVLGEESIRPPLSPQNSNLLNENRIVKPIPDPAGAVIAVNYEISKSRFDVLRQPARTQTMLGFHLFGCPDAQPEKRTKDDDGDRATEDDFPIVKPAVHSASFLRRLSLRVECSNENIIALFNSVKR